MKRTLVCLFLILMIPSIGFSDENPPEGKSYRGPINPKNTCERPN